MVRIKSESEIKAAYEESTALVPRRFKAGVQTAEWQAQALEGQALYEEMMARADVLARRASGISRVSNEQWRSNTIDKGSTIIGARMKAASGKQIAGFRPYREALAGLTLPPKTADPMANLLNRAGAVVSLMVEVKEAQG